MADPRPGCCQHCGGDVIFGRPSDTAHRTFFHARTGMAACPPPVDLAMFEVVPNGDMDDPPALICRRCHLTARRVKKATRVFTLADLVAEATYHQDHDCTVQPEARSWG